MMKVQYGWVLVAIGALMSCVALGTMMSLAVFLQPITEATGWSRTGVSSAMTLNFLVMGAAGFGWGALNDRFGTRPVVLTGAVLLGLGLVLASRAASQTQFVLAYGLIVGVSAGSLFVPMMTAVSAWLPERRSLAVSLVSAGMGVAPMTISPVAAWLLETTDWRSAQLMIGLAVWTLLVPAALFVRPAPRESGAAAGATGEPPMRAGEALRSTPFIVLAATFFACCATHAGPIFHTISYALVCGIPTVAAVTIYSLEGLAGLGGRVVFGLAGDRYGARRVLMAGLFVQAFAAGSFVFAQRLGEFYAVAAVFGFAYGGVMPLYAVLARDYFGQRIMGTVLGAAAFISSLGMALGPWLGGWIYDSFGSYAWMYIGSFAIGLGAAAIAFAFPAPRRLESAHASPAPAG
ncbi:MAG TPA: MFS transporter [Burkholderiales bacterium]|nr:MFS transporter [Burkholderiales bacterium]